MAKLKASKRPIHGVILLDKPTGLTSNKALQKVKHHFAAKKAGHTGSLDPLASGLLPLCFGQATKVSEYFLNSHKKYTTVIKLGETTDTLDADGEIVVTRAVQVADEQIQNVLAQFRGEIKQVPPMYSALKKDGQPLYKLARKGETIERAARDMIVHSLEAVRLDQYHVALKVHCSSGFYIRSLAYDLGEALGCGAHVVALRRTDIKSISVTQARSLEQIVNAELDTVLLPIDALLQDFSKIEISQSQALSLIQGRVTPANGLETNGLTRLYRPDGYLFGLGEVNERGELKTKKLFIEE